MFHYSIFHRYTGQYAVFESEIAPRSERWDDPDSAFLLIDYVVIPLPQDLSLRFVGWSPNAIGVVAQAPLATNQQIKKESASSSSQRSPSSSQDAQGETWGYEGSSPGTITRTSTMGAAPSSSVLPGVMMVWENRPTRAGMYWIEVPLPSPIPWAEADRKIRENPTPHTENFYAGAFEQRINGAWQQVYGADFERAFEDNAIVFGEGEGEYRFTDKFYAYGGTETKTVERMFFYCVLSEDAITEGLDPSSTSAYYDGQGQLMYEQDAAGKRWTPPAAQETVGFLPAIPFAIKFLVVFVVFLLGYFGYFGTTIQRFSTRVVRLGTSAAGKIVKPFVAPIQAGLLIGIPLMLAIFAAIAAYKTPAKSAKE